MSRQVWALHTKKQPRQVNVCCFQANGIANDKNQPIPKQLSVKRRFEINALLRCAITILLKQYLKKDAPVALFLIVISCDPSNVRQCELNFHTGKTDHYDANAFSIGVGAKFFTCYANNMAPPDRLDTPTLKEWAFSATPYFNPTLPG